VLSIDIGDLGRVATIRYSGNGGEVTIPFPLAG
jgi:hypothetical protein